MKFAEDIDAENIPAELSDATDAALDAHQQARWMAFASRGLRRIADSPHTPPEVAERAMDIQSDVEGLLDDLTDHRDDRLRWARDLRERVTDEATEGID